MTNFEAAIQVLKEAGGPLHYREITERALERGLIEPHGKTPEATMAAALYGHVKQAAEKDAPPVLNGVGRGKFALASKKLGGSVEADIQRNNDRVRAELHEYLRDLHPRQFELLIGQLLGAIGFEDVVVSKYSGDGGIDVDATLTVGGVTRVRTAVQVKRYKKNVPGSTVRELRGGLMTDQRGLIITTAGFTKDAIAEASADGKTPISLIAGEKLVQLLSEHQIGVRKRMVQLLELNLEEILTGEGGEDAGTGDKSAALWPLPGGQDKFFETLLEFIDEIGANSPTVDEMAAWVVAHYEKVNKHDLVKSYLRTALYSMGLIAFDGEQVLLTESGESLRKSRDRSELLGYLRDNVLGVVELLRRLEEGPMTTAEALDFFKSSLGVEWETENQVRFRLQWLTTCRAVERVGKAWQARENEGRSK